MKKTFFLILAIALLAAGCSILEQARDDYQIGKDTPFAEGEKTPQQRTDALVNTMSGIPYANLAAPVVAIAGPYLFFWLRGRKLRKAQAKSTNPITGHVGATIGAETLVQHVADVRAGLFEVGADGSGFKRLWKVLVAGLLASPILVPTLYPAIIDVIHNFISAPPSWLSGVALTLATSLGTALVAYLEKQIAKVLPLSSDPATIPPIAIP